MKALPRRRRRLVTIVKIAWNAHANHPSQGPRVVKAIDQWVAEDPTVQRIALTEAKGAYPQLRDWCRRNGWAHLQEKGNPADRADERGDTAVLIRRRGPGKVKVLRARVKPMREEWTVWSHRQRHKPRRHRWERLKVDRVRISTAAHHGPTQGNHAAVAESIDAARRFLTRRGGRVILDGDLNLTDDQVAQLADDTGCQVKGRRPDYTLTSGRILSDEKLAGGGSDHPARKTTVQI